MHTSWARRACGAFAISIVLLIAAPSQAADPTPSGPMQVPVTDQAVIRVLVGRGEVTIKTWDRSAVQIESDDDVAVHRQSARFGNAGLPTELPLVYPIVTTPVNDNGTPVSLPAEDFVVSTLPPGMHDIVAISGKQLNGPMTVTIPNSAGLVSVGIGAGKLTMSGYRGGTFIAQVRGGMIRLENMAGDGFAQVLNGPVIATDSTFNRLRVRTALRNMFFDRCHVRQIEATSVNGSIFFNEGAFEAGLARFESERGSIAIGLAGGAGARFGALSAAGKIYTAFERRGTFDQVRPGEVVAVIENGGPLVSVKTTDGAVYLYNGAIISKHDLPPEWNPVRNAVNVRIPQLSPRTGSASSAGGAAPAEKVGEPAAPSGGTKGASEPGQAGGAAPAPGHAGGGAAPAPGHPGGAAPGHPGHPGHPGGAAPGHPAPAPHPVPPAPHPAPHPHGG